MKRRLVPLLDISKLDARVEPGAIIRENVSIGKQAVIMMGAIINIGAEIGARTMIDMGAVLGGRAVVGCDCHIGAGAVLRTGKRKDCSNRRRRVHRCKRRCDRRLPHRQKIGNRSWCGSNR